MINRPVADSAQRLDEPCGADLLAERPRCELGAVIGVDHRAWARAAAVERHGERGVDHGRCGAAVQGPAHDLAGPGDLVLSDPQKPAQLGHFSANALSRRQERAVTLRWGVRDLL